MAIGDAIAVYLGTAQTARQPSSGVFERITAYNNNGAGDNGIVVYDGSSQLYLGAGITYSGFGTAGVVRGTPYNMCHMSGNTVYILKNGTSTTCYLGGVQVDT